MKKNKHNCSLSGCSFCMGCSREWLPAIDSARQTFMVRKGEEFIVEGERLTGIYFVYEGSVKVHKKWGEKELIVRFAGKGDIVGHRGLGIDFVCPISATALEPSLVCFLPLDFFLTSLKVNADYLLRLMLFFAEELKVSERKMRNLAHMPVKGRVAQALINLETKFGVSAQGFINLGLSRQDLASYIGATYETVFRVLNDLAEEKLVSFSGKNILLLDREKLTTVAGLPA